MLGNIGTVELLLIMLAVLLVFGAKRIPEIAQGLGKGIREFRSAMKDISAEFQVEDQQIRRATNTRPTSVRSTPTVTPTASTGASGTSPGAQAPLDDAAPVPAQTPSTPPVDTAQRLNTPHV